MNTKFQVATRLPLILAALALVACDKGEANRAEPAQEARGHDHAHEDGEQSMPSNRVVISPSVRSNLGISFVTVEQRRIEQTLRAPGRFEYLPSARREYRTMLPGRVELLVSQFQQVEKGTPLYRIESPAWREHQQKLTDAAAAIQRLTTRLASFDPLLQAHQEHEQQLKETIDIRRERVEQLEQIAQTGGGRRQELMEARSELSTAQADLSEVQEDEARLDADQAEAQSELAAAVARRDLLLNTASTFVGLPVDALTERVESERKRLARWQTIAAITVRAEEPGTVETLGLTNGAWATEESAVLTVVKPDQLRFHASGLQSDLGALQSGLKARIVPPTPTAVGRSVPLNETMTGTLTLGLSGDPDERTIDLYVVPDSLAAWARPGVSAQVEIVTDATAAPQLAIPLAAVQRDGLTPVIFRRAPDNPNEAIRMEADLGMDDGRWIAVLSGLRTGDEVVLDGAFQLMLATSGSIQKGGHFHADGTFHEGED